MIGAAAYFVVSSKFKMQSSKLMSDYFNWEKVEADAGWEL